MRNFTEGPWVIDDGMDSPENMADEILRSAGGEDEWVAVGICDEEGYASSVAYCHPNNAPLIAEAPALLDALDDAVEALNAVLMADIELDRHFASALSCFYAKGKKVLDRLQ